MDKSVATLIYHAMEFTSEYGTWFEFCDYLSKRGVTPETIARICNEASEKSGHVSPDLTSKDCE
jgi:hypothetical protein